MYFCCAHLHKFDKISKTSIIIIDKNAYVCYNESKLENKTNILTTGDKNKNNKNKKENIKMTEKLKIPNQVVESDWKDDISYQTYGTDQEEMEYISPAEVSKESINKIKARNLKRGQTILNIFNKRDLVA